MRKFLVILSLLGLSACQEAIADVPLPLGRPADYSRIGGAVWGRSHSVPTTAAISGVVGESGTVTAVAEAHLFDWGTPVTINCEDFAATYCWVMDVEVTMTAAGALTDPDTGTGIGQDGTGPCFRVSPGPFRDNTPWRDTFRGATKIGRRVGYCSGNATTANWPCNEDTDCSTDGVCNLTSSNGQAPFERIKGAFLVSRAASAAACFVTEEK